MTLPETVEHHYREEHQQDEEEDVLSDDDIFGPARTILRRTKNKISMISNELRLREKRKRVLQLCLRKLERIKDSENNLRRSVVIHNTFSRLSNDIKRDKERGQNRNQQQQNYKWVPDIITAMKSLWAWMSELSEREIAKKERESGIRSKIFNKSKKETHL